MTQEISSLMDGELEAVEAERAIRSCCSSGEAAEKWRTYHLIGEAMRGEGPYPTHTAQRVHDMLDREPVIIARRRPVLDSTIGRVALAAAASVATVGVVGWIGTQGGAPATGAPVAAVSSHIEPVSNKTTVAPAPVELQEYLALHRQMPSPDLYRPVHHRASAAAR